MNAVELVGVTLAVCMGFIAMTSVYSWWAWRKFQQSMAKAELQERTMARKRGSRDDD